MFHDNPSDDSADGSTNNTLKLCLLVAGVFLDICAVYFVTKYAKEELDKVSSNIFTIIRLELLIHIIHFLFDLTLCYKDF